MAESLPSREIQQLLDTALDRATTSLEEDGGFFPFALAIEADRPDDDDELAMLEAGPDVEELEEGDEVEMDEEEAVEALLEAIRETSASYRAVAIVFDSVADDEWDAVSVLLAHRDGAPVDAVLPYRVSGRKRVFADLEQEPGSLDVWS
ncbi:hypothetical protein QT381_12630 [Galbitalea sp. SE-J8]|uniref:hypothetical protein n=1 Tax=Galbitalea sp. SE-J8 TaxID=3054952 RepID=UPI00259CE53E|nr:hypothetical protein [Galbitalea sp. SE-J8]MDM4763854.1 hypothetical protein [Galbitalea sp. SE-J8]